MKFKSILALGAVFFLSTFCGKKETYTNINVEKAMEMINESSLRLVDVRTKSEFDAGHIKGAENIDFKSDTFVTSMSKGDKDQLVLIYCRSGRRSAAAAYQMDSLGYTNVYNMLGGYLAWEKIQVKE